MLSAHIPVRIALAAAALACGACAAPPINYPPFATVASPRVLAEHNGVRKLAGDPDERDDQE